MHAVIWDYDGTLVDSSARNLAATRAILERLTGRAAEEFPAVTSPGRYQAAIRRSRNWRDLYAREFGLGETEVDQAGALWTEYQRASGGVPGPETPVFPGIPETLRALAAVPHGIVSQNASAVIAAELTARRLSAHFRIVIGFEDVPRDRQKPAPDGLLRCAEALAREGGTLFYVGDHETDAACAALARVELAGRLRVVSIAACWAEPAQEGWTVEPDHRAGRPGEVVEIVRGYVEVR